VNRPRLLRQPLKPKGREAHKSFPILGRTLPAGSTGKGVFRQVSKPNFRRRVIEMLFNSSVARRVADAFRANEGHERSTATNCLSSARG